MTRRSKPIRLYEKAEAALISAIEIYNKPSFAYREETFAILAINAWELLLKAKVLAENDNKLRALYIYERRTNADGMLSKKSYPKRNRVGNLQTIGLGAAIVSLERKAETRLPTEVRANLEALIEVRDNAVHFVSAGFALAKSVLEIGTASLKNFVALAEKWFGRDLSAYSLYLMPIGFLATPAATAIATAKDEGRLVSYLRNLVATQSATTSSSSYHIALDVNISFKRSATDAISTFTLTNDPNAPHVYLTEEDIRAKYPWDYSELVRRCRARYSDFKENEEFHKIRRPLLDDSRFARYRFLDPGNPRSSKKLFHNTNILSEFDKHFTKKES